MGGGGGGGDMEPGEGIQKKSVGKGNRDKEKMRWIERKRSYPTFGADLAGPCQDRAKERSQR